MKVKLSKTESSKQEFIDIDKLDTETKAKLKKYLENEGAALASCGGMWRCNMKEHGVIAC